VNPSGKRKLVAWLPTVIWACLIFTLSTSSFSAANTLNYIYPVLLWLFPFASHNALMLLHQLIRKAAHVTEYFIFGLLVLHGIRAGRREWQLRWALTAIGIAFVYASSDEFHQIFVPGRHASPYDVMIDTAGASLAQIAAYLVARRRRPDPQMETAAPESERP